MSLLGIDIGGTKLALAIFNIEGKLLQKETVALENRKGTEVGDLINHQILRFMDIALSKNEPVTSIGASVPGIYRMETGTVWAPNIAGWDDYPLLNEVKKISGKIKVSIDSDRACYILGELWKGNAQQCKDAIFLSVGTGIGAGIIVNGEVLRGTHDVAGSIGWMALNQPFREDYTTYGCFESVASGDGIARLACRLLDEQPGYKGELRNFPAEKITSHDIFHAFRQNDFLAKQIIEYCIRFWGMAIANLVSLFNPEKIILGGGIFGPALDFLPEIITEATKWAQPISMKQVSIEASGLGGDAGIFGAGFLALQNNNSSIS